MSAQYRIPIALAKAEGLRGLYFLFGGWHVPAGINFATEACARLSAGVKRHLVRSERHNRDMQVRASVVVSRPTPLAQRKQADEGLLNQAAHAAVRTKDSIFELMYLVGPRSS